MRNLYITFIVLFLLIGCKSESYEVLAPIINKYEITFDNQKDTLIDLNNGMQMKVEQSTFDSPSPITIKYIPITSAEDFVSNKVSTLTSDGRDIKTVGMIKINFFDSQGNEVFPKKDYILLSKEGITSKDVKFFYGSARNDHTVWNEFENKIYKVEFIPNIFSDTGFENLLLQNGDTLTSYLDYLYKDRLFEDSIKCRIGCTLDLEKGNLRVESFRWRKSKVNKQFEIEIRNLFKELSIKDVTQPFQSIEYWDLLAINNKSKYLSNMFQERFVIKTSRVGWLNYDIYIEEEPGYVIVNSDDDLYISSIAEDRNVFPFLKEGAVNKFRIPIENSNEKMILLNTKDGVITQRREIELVQGDTLYINS